ncbi:class I SAM-dependent methyltransferase [Pseudoalteromonas tunicata]|jgi:23S rRNA (cytosine1962-C5)-methyltransferase|uniref:S-adenosylmethionine-dependent methyltransferase domain-containing protein n=1 Tax=Pseudoalteromonas tunicata D2 TaxID=87626 RepID=A4CBA9_9GAMM|nr:class I SAM-dependent methyltransferase [Pseudoalteromonas tunicata]ATC94201.1 23S rRNA (cytosine1962-C5)-methyltransferase [Pseudoalteromonas tunicata]AXT29961.1 23S rRNA methyltransferase [Pseudoalteromonas tunicata]EAR27646.1 hypothetical protein PTD2_17530 [Pseudoalteromonas tunicata D2]MDP4983043.1 class I SAM-dependent methyltransferase [Pseudoalteromonas tunicata]
MPNLDFTPLITALKAAPIANKELARVFHGRGHSFATLEHLNLDFYPPYLFLVGYEPLAEQDLEALTSQITKVIASDWPSEIDGLIYQDRSVQPVQSQVLIGTDPGSFVIQELGIQYHVELTRSQNTGIFPDMRVGREFVMRHARDAKVLNLFSYTCGFSLAAMQGGAYTVVNMDMNKGVLKVGQNNHRLNQFDKNVSYFPHDILKSFGKLKKLAPFDLLIIDPPSFQKGSFVLTKDYQKIIRRLPELMAPDSVVLLCANSPELSEPAFKALIAAHCDNQLIFIERLAAAPGFIEVDSDRSLKALVYKKV